MFKDRYEAGRFLAEKLLKYKGKNAIILAIPRGALQIGIEISKKLGLPLSIVVTKKIPYPGNPELAIGAVDANGEYNLHDISSEVPKSYIDEKVQEITAAVKEKYDKMGVKPPKLEGKIAIIVDDGIAMGSTIKAAIRYVKKQNPEKIIVAVPVSSVEGAERIKNDVDEFISLDIPPDFMAVGQFYLECVQSFWWFAWCRS